MQESEVREDQDEMVSLEHYRTEVPESSQQPWLLYKEAWAKSSQSTFRCGRRKALAEELLSAADAFSERESVFLRVAPAALQWMAHTPASTAALLRPCRI